MTPYEYHQMSVRFSQADVLQRIVQGIEFVLTKLDKPRKIERQQSHDFIDSDQPLSGTCKGTEPMNSKSDKRFHEQEDQRILEEELEHDDERSRQIIAERTAEIRAGWSAREEQSRRGDVFERHVEIRQYLDNRRNQR